MSENDQHSGPKQDYGENVAIFSAPITKLKIKRTTFKNRSGLK